MITVTPDLLSSPPRNAVTVGVPSGAVMQSARVWRNDPAGKVDLQQQPVVGFESRTVYDYQCPFEVSRTYGWSGSYTTTVGTEWDEVWSDTAAWTIDAGAFTVDAGSLKYTGALGRMHRLMTQARHRITFDGMSVTSFMRIDVRILADAAGSTNGGAIILTLTPAGGTIQFSRVQDPGNATSIDLTQQVTIDFLAGAIVVTADTGSRTVLDTFEPRRIDIWCLGFGEALVDEIKVENYGASTNIAQSSDVVTLDEHNAWLVHPSSPGKSFKLQNVDPELAGIRTFGDLSRPANANLVNILGSDLLVPVSTSPRGGAQLSATIVTVSSAERAALDAVMRDEVPLLVQVPPSWQTDFESGFYAFGTSVERRQLGWLSLPHASRVFEIPLTRVPEPIVDVETVGWTCAALLAEFATCADELLTFDTTSDLLVNNRS